MKVGAALRALGKIEAKLEAEAAKAKEIEPEDIDAEKEPEIPAKKTDPEPKIEISKAPAPINPLKGANKPVESRVDSTGKYLGSYEQYKKDRRDGKIK
jgi:hypothetical protein